MKKKYLFDHLRPVIIQRQIEKSLPGIWEYAQVMRANRGKAFPNWPDWCYLPIAGWNAVTLAALNREKPTHETSSLASTAAAVGPWRFSKGIYRFDPELYEALLETPITEDTPTEIFYRLPELCVYIESPGLSWKDNKIHGFFAHLESDEQNRRDALRLLIDCEGLLFSTMLNLNEGDVLGGLRELYAPTMDRIFGVMSKILTLLMYICSDEPDYSDRIPPVRATPQRAKGAEKWFAPAGVKTWDVGVRIGAAIRKHKRQTAEREAAVPSAGQHTPRRPHVRSAHWHGYWTGKRSEPEMRKFVLRWIPPLMINMSDEETPVVIRPVKE